MRQAMVSKKKSEKKLNLLNHSKSMEVVSTGFQTPRAYILPIACDLFVFSLFRTVDVESVDHMHKK